MIYKYSVSITIIITLISHLEKTNGIHLVFPFDLFVPNMHFLGRNPFKRSGELVYGQLFYQ